nr:MAG TPA: hypothetical protein [Caudoviricetes sp.]
MDERQQFTIMDVLNIISFYIGLKNLDLNFTQDMAGKMLDTAVNDIHAHLKEQDEKLALIMRELGVEYNEKNKNVS